jgi:hypothetical protein
VTAPGGAAAAKPLSAPVEGAMDAVDVRNKSIFLTEFGSKKCNRKVTVSKK